MTAKLDRWKTKRFLPAVIQPSSSGWDFAYLAYRLVPLGENGGSAAPHGKERLSRLDALIEAYGVDFEYRNVLDTVSARLDELATYTDGRAATTGRSDLLDHSAMYRRDRDLVAALAVRSAGLRK